MHPAHLASAALAKAPALLAASDSLGLSLVDNLRMLAQHHSPGASGVPPEDSLRLDLDWTQAGLDA